MKFEASHISLDHPIPILTLAYSFTILLPVSTSWYLLTSMKVRARKNSVVTGIYLLHSEIRSSDPDSRIEVSQLGVAVSYRISRVGLHRSIMERIRNP